MKGKRLLGINGLLLLNYLVLLRQAKKKKCEGNELWVMFSHIAK
jgi:hypothetical protein